MKGPAEKHVGHCFSHWIYSIYINTFPSRTQCGYQKGKEILCGFLKTYIPNFLKQLYKKNLFTLL